MKAFQGGDLLGVWGKTTGQKGVSPETPFIHERSRQALRRSDGYESFPHRMVREGFEKLTTRLRKTLAAENYQTQGIRRWT